MNPLLLAAPAVEPVGLAEMKSYLRLDTGDEDDLVLALIQSARLTVEAATGLALLAQSWRIRLARPPSDGVVPVPLSPLMSLDAVRSVPASGAPVTVDPDLYRLDEAANPVRLLLDRTLPFGTGGLEIDVTAGFGPSPEWVPQPLRLALRRLCAHWFEHRGDARGAGASALPGEVSALLAPFVRARLA
jgi:uncharacterized phiE125 gp8 family phage protein